MTCTTSPTFLRWAFGALMLAVSALGAAAQAPQPATICVDVDVKYTDRHPAAVLVSSLEDEASAIWERYGVHLAWPRSARPESCAPPQASFVVLVSDDHVQSATPANQLGSTHVFPGLIDRAPICVDQDRTEGVLAILTPVELSRAVSRPALGPADVGRALGRVLAHELGHVLLAARAHQKEGLMRPTFGLEELVRPQRESLTLSPAEVDLLRARLFSGVPTTYRAPLASLRCGPHVIGH